MRQFPQPYFSVGTQLIAIWLFFQTFYFAEFTKRFHILHLTETSQQQYSIINVRLGKLFSSELNNLLTKARATMTDYLFIHIFANPGQDLFTVTFHAPFIQQRANWAQRAESIQNLLSVLVLSATASTKH